MNIAYLITAHHQPNHLRKMVNALDCLGAYFFIHIDAKVNISQFKLSLTPKNNIVYLPNHQRIKVYWGGFSQVNATLNLLSASLNSGHNFDRFVLLSGVDFPIKNNHSIQDAFSSGKEFICVDRYLSGGGTNSYCKNVTRYNFFDLPISPSLNRLLLSGKIPRKIYPQIALFHGASWWALTRECVEEIQQFTVKNKDYIDFHKYTLSADEIFFHSIVKQSAFAANISHDVGVRLAHHVLPSINEHGCHYIDWNSKNVKLPKVLDMSDLDTLLGSKALFARKFDEKISGKLLVALEKNLNFGPVKS